MKKASLVGKRIEKENKFTLQEQIKELENRISELNST